MCPSPAIPGGRSIVSVMALLQAAAKRNASSGSRTFERRPSSSTSARTPRESPAHPRVYRPGSSKPRKNKKGRSAEDSDDNESSQDSGSKVFERAQSIRESPAKASLASPAKALLARELFGVHDDDRDDGWPSAEQLFEDKGRAGDECVMIRTTDERKEVKLC